jgi:hypothetical protein
METHVQAIGERMLGTRTLRWALAAATAAGLQAVGGWRHPEAGSARTVLAAGLAPVAQVDSARAALMAMSRRLAAARSFTVDAVREVDAALMEGRDVPDSATIRIEVRRPDQVHTLSRGGGTERHFYFDGRAVTQYDATRQMYATTPVRGTIDDMIRALDERFGFVPPLAEFMSNDPWAFLSSQVRTARMAGVQKVNGRTCRVIRVTGELADATVWIGADDSLPCALVATFTRREGSPQVRAAFGEWRRGAALPDSRFAFVPPPGARQIPMLAVPGGERVR